MNNICDKIKDLKPEQIVALTELMQQFSSILGDGKLDFVKIRENKALSEIMKINSKTWVMINEENYFEKGKYTPEINEYQIRQLCVGLPFYMISDEEKIIPTFVKYSDIDFVVYPSEQNNINYDSDEDQFVAQPRNGMETELSVATIPKTAKRAKSKGKRSDNEETHGFEILTLSEFRTHGYWKLFEYENTGKPISEAFTCDPKLKNVFYPNCWEMYKHVKKDKQLRNCLITAVENMHKLPDF